MRKLWPILFFFTGCASVSSDINHLSPQFKPTPPPADCHLISILKNSPAERSGLKVGDHLLKINGVAPADAAAVSDLINKAPPTTTLDIEDSSASLHVVTVTLNADYPRLGAVCDLNGWGKGGLSIAGNESLTLFEGPYSVTLSGIIDDAKSLTLLRAHIVNHSNDPIHIGSDIFTAQEANGKEVRVFTPEQTMCVLYGEKGARLLKQQPKTKQALDHDTAPSSEPTAAETSLCAGVDEAARLGKSGREYAEANAKSVAEDSLWPTQLAAGATADGLIYLQKPESLPLTVRATFAGEVFTFDMGKPQAAVKTMSMMTLDEFFQAQKKGTPLRVTLKKGRVIVSKFLSYDAIEEVAWFEAPADSLLKSASYPLRSIRSAEKIDQ